MIKVDVILVCYNPDLNELNHNFSSSFSMFNNFVVIDNSDAEEVRTKVSDYCTRQGLYYISHGYNMGIAKAQNVGIEFLLNKGSDYISFFDQDSLVPENYVKRMDEAARYLTEKNITVGSINPLPVDSFTNKPFKAKISEERNIGNYIYEVNQVISSGQMISSKVLEQVGGMEEGLFIDAVDTEWCYRAKSRGFGHFVVSNLKMIHTLGNDRGKFMGVNYKISSPIRLYYQTRNLFLMLTRGYFPSYWKVRNLALIIFRLVVFSIKGPERTRRVHYILKGILHGIFRVKGKLI